MAGNEKKRDPLFAAAVLKLSFRLGNNEKSPAFKLIYDGVLRDLGVEDEAVDRFLTENYEKVLKAARGKERGEP
jgi:hypothetical protein